MRGCGARGRGIWGREPPDPTIEGGGDKTMYARPPDRSLFCSQDQVAWQGDNFTSAIVSNELVRVFDATLATPNCDSWCHDFHI